MLEHPFPNHKLKPLESEDLIISHFPNIPTGNQHQLPRRVFRKRMHVGRDENWHDNCKVIYTRGYVTWSLHIDTIIPFQLGQNSICRDEKEVQNMYVFDVIIVEKNKVFFLVWQIAWYLSMLVKIIFCLLRFERGKVFPLLVSIQRKLMYFSYLDNHPNYSLA